MKKTLEPTCVTCSKRLILGNLCRECATATAGKSIDDLKEELTEAVKKITCEWGKPVATIYHIASRMTYVRYGKNHKSQQVTPDQVEEIMHWMGKQIPGCSRVKEKGTEGWRYME